MSLRNLNLLFKSVQNHEAGDDNDEDGEEEKDGIKALSAPRLPLLALENVFLSGDLSDAEVPQMAVKDSAV